MSASVAERVSWWRLGIAVLALPLFDALVVYLAFPVVSSLGQRGTSELVALEEPARVFAGISGALALFIMITAALPVTVWLIRRGQTSMHHFALAGSVLANLPFAIYAWTAFLMTLGHLISGTLGQHLSPVTDLLVSGVRLVVMGSIIGAISGAVFWLIAGPTPVPVAAD